MNIKPDTRLIDLTVADLMLLIKEQINLADDNTLPRYVYGLNGIMQIFNCSKSTAARIRKSGKIDRAIRQYGKEIIIDTHIALNSL